MKGKRYQINSILPLLLFCVFAILAMTTAAVSIHAFRSEQTRANENYNDRILFSYVSQKVRQTTGSVEVDEVEGLPALVLIDEPKTEDSFAAALSSAMPVIMNPEEQYITYIYQYDGSLCELYIRADLEPTAEAGERIARAGGFDAEYLKDNLLKLTFVNSAGREEPLFINVR